VEEPAAEDLDVGSPDSVLSEEGSDTEKDVAGSDLVFEEVIDVEVEKSEVKELKVESEYAVDIVVRSVKADSNELDMTVVYVELADSDGVELV
jgi:hypothetical protein